MLTVIHPVENNSWLCSCDCGGTVVRTSLCLRRAKNKNASSSCGCKPARSTHGLCNTFKKLHWVWTAMKQRCNNSSNKDYPNYGGRGVAICDAWYSFENFHEWALSSGYAKGMTIERINVNGHYEPSNCTWIVNEQQADNRQRSRRFEYRGRQYTVRELSNLCQINYLTLRARLVRYGWSVERALSEHAFRGKNQTFRGECK